MKIFLQPILFTLVTLLSFCGELAFAQVKSPEKEAEKKKVVPAEKPERGMIWKVVDEDNTIYLAGSVHLLRERDMPIPLNYDKAYEESAEVVFELDESAMSDPKALAAIQKMGMLPSGESLSDHFSEKTMRRIYQFASPFGMPPAALDRMKPGMVFVTLSLFEALKDGAKAELGLESIYYEKVRKDGKASRGLETAEYQMARFDQLEVEEIEKTLNQSLDDISNKVKGFDKLIAAWKIGDAERMNRLISKHMEVGSDIRRLLLTERNENWIPEIEKAIADSTNTMFMVGAAHLVGDDGVVSLLRKNGFTVTQLGAKKGAATGGE